MLLKLTKLRSYVAAMKARGYSAEAVLLHSRLTAEQLLDPAMLIEPSQRQQVVRNMLRLTRNPALGLELGYQSQLVDFGILAHAQMTAATLRDAFTLWERYYSAVGTTTPIELEEKSRDDWRVIYRVTEPEGPVGRFNAEEITSMAVTLGPALVGTSWALEECTYTYSPPSYWKRYEALLGCPVHFNQPFTSIRVKGIALDHALPGHDPEFHALCLRHLHQLIRRIDRERPFTDRVRSLLVSRHTNLPTLDETASYLGMSPRSMRRHLLDEQTSYIEQLNQYRLELALHFLGTEQRSAKDVAAELGYRDVGSFRRAFKQWTGRTVASFAAESD